MSFNLKKHPHDQFDDQPNTNQVSQKALEKLYLGQKCSADRKMSRIMSSLFVLVFFSSGMPVMYLLGTIFFTLTYLINKVLFMQYYQKTDTTLSREIPLFSTWILPLAIIIKLTCGIFMYADADIFSSRASLSETGEYTLPEDLHVM